MRWTTEQPTQSGWYWWRYTAYENSPPSRARCGLVLWFSGGRTSQGPSDQLRLEGRPIKKIETVEWSDAPIAEPT
jgi:hypothetical protein